MSKGPAMVDRRWKNSAKTDRFGTVLNTLIRSGNIQLHKSVFKTYL